MQKIIVSNTRFPEDDWLMLKSLALEHGISVNEYLKFLTRSQSIKEMTNIKKTKPKKDPYQAMDEFIKFVRNHKAKPMGASEEDKIIYDL